MKEYHKIITPEVYKALPKETQDMYLGVYKKYKKKRVSDSCYECGHSLGWTYIQGAGIGKPYKYKLIEADPNIVFGDRIFSAVSLADSVDWIEFSEKGIK